MIWIKNTYNENEMLQGLFGLENQGRKYVLHKGLWKVRDSEEILKFLHKKSGKVREKIQVENEVSRSTFGFQNCFP